MCSCNNITHLIDDRLFLIYIYKPGQPFSCLYLYLLKKHQEHHVTHSFLPLEEEADASWSRAVRMCVHNTPTTKSSSIPTAQVGNIEKVWASY